MFKFISFYPYISYIQTEAKAKYGAPAEKVDFSQAAETADTINKWVADNTKGMIKELFSAADMGEHITTSCVFSLMIYYT